MDYLLQQLLNALSLGGEYALLALGLAIVFSVMGLVNFAHGDLITVGGYAMFLVVVYLGLSNPVMLLPVGVLSVVLFAVFLEKVAFKPVRGAPPTTGMLMAFGISILIQNIALIFVGTRPKPVPTADFLMTNITIGSVRIPMVQILETAVTVVAISLLVVFLRRTTIGMAMRAAAKDVSTVRLMGIRADRVVTTAFAISGFLAGLATVFILARRGAVDPFMGFTPVLKAFVAAVIGGFGSLPGAVLGGFALGISEVMLQVILPDYMAGFRDAFIFTAVGVLLLVRPQGILGERPDFGEKS
ncbi:branched-chain amino acid ABC transporter permease [Microbaculum marinisediminis]|uniref:Branched-chain amino acid ABC transporter permease n=1 Tax=Microbaculum marinisediminis TaxID=2931392 RepID=A0AAW5QV81_9HYPH|nr:branched-chain amino acid ABC transporter permease [Microbaculum sp. A6E488]MCT8971409.1 branched-chain amino acid ABC transporter permease [Microbaculum sp. A6E488]